MTSTHLKELALGFVKHIVYAINSDKAATDSGSLTEHVVRNGQGEIVWRAYKNGTAAHRVAKSKPDYTVDSRKLTVTIELGKWESEKEAPKIETRKFKVGDRVASTAPSYIHGNGKTGIITEIRPESEGAAYPYLVKFGNDPYSTPYSESELTPQTARLSFADPQIPDHKPTFQKGDRVRIQSNAAKGFWSGKLGTVLGPWVDSQGRSSKMYDYSVSVDGRINDVAFRADELTLELAAWEAELLNAKPAKPEPKFKVGQEVKTFYQGYTVRGRITRLPVEGTLYAAPSPYYIVSVSYKFSFETVHRTEDEIYE